jgi:hypothetical protein
MHKKIRRPIDMRAGKEITEEEYAAKKSALMKEKYRIEQLLHDGQRNADEWYKKADEVFTFAETAVSEFNKGGLEKKREIFVRLGSNLIIKDKKLHVDLENSLIPMKNISKEVKKIHERLEPVERVDRKTQIEYLYSQNPSLLGSKDSNLE